MEKRFAHLVWPPKFRPQQIQSRNSIGRKSNFLGFVGGEFDILGEIDKEATAFDSAAQSSLYRSGGGVIGKCTDGEMGELGFREVQFGLNKRMAHGNRPTGRNHHFLPQPHVFVRWGWIPIYPSDAKFARFRRRNRNGDNVFDTHMNKIGDVEIIAAKRTNHFVRAGEFFSIDPYFRPVIDATKLHPDLLALVGGWQLKFFAIPPRNS